MSGLFARAGVDYGQWRVVTRALLRADFRPRASMTGAPPGLQAALGPLGMVAIFGLFGAACAAIIALNPDVRLTGTLTLTVLAFGVTTALLTHHGATLLSGADLAILGTRPVSSQTLFAIRATNVTCHALVMTTLMAYPPVAAYAMAHGVHVMRGIGAAMAIYAWATAVAFAVVAGYAALVHVAGGARMQRLVAYAQLGAGLVVYGGFIVVMEIAGVEGLSQARLPDVWSYTLPPAWFAAFIEAADGVGGPAVYGRVAAAVLLLVALVALLRGTLAASYAERLAEPAPHTEAREAPTVFAIGFRRDEAHAVALLTAAHVRHDLRVRMGLFALVPLLVLYLFLGLRTGADADPFTAPASAGTLDMLAMATLLFPAILLRHLETSDAFGGAWIFAVTPADRGRLIVALKNVAVRWFLLPFAALVGALLTVRFGHAGHALAHTAVLIAVAHAALLIAVLLRPRLPFASPPQKSDSIAVFVWMTGVMVGGQFLLAAVQRFVYPSWGRVAVCLGGLAALSMLLEASVRKRARRG